MRTARLAAIVVPLVLLAGCFRLPGDGYEEVHRDGGITKEQAEQMLEAVPGVTEAVFTAAFWSTSGGPVFGASEGMDLVLEVRFDDGYHIGDMDAALEQLVQVAWAANVHSPKGYVLVLLDGGVSPNARWAPVAERVFGNGKDLFAVNPQLVSYTEDSFDFAGKSGVKISADLDERLGQWPGNGPEKLDLALEAGAYEPIVVPALDDASVTASPVWENCWEASVQMNEQYDGQVRVDLVVDGAVTDTTTLSSSNAWVRDPDAPATTRPAASGKVCSTSALPSQSRTSVLVTPLGDPELYDLAPKEVPFTP